MDVADSMRRAQEESRSELGRFEAQQSLDAALLALKAMVAALRDGRLNERGELVLGTSAVAALREMADSAIAEARGELRFDVCSICRRRHGPEVVHACE